MIRRLTTLAYRLVLCYWPCLWCAGGRVTDLSPDFRRLRVRLNRNWRTRNVFNVIFGGSMYASTDPMYVLMLMKILGPGFVTWDKGCTIHFRRPAVGRMYADFEITDAMLAQITDGVRDHGEITVTWPTAFKDTAGITYAEFEKVIYVARKDVYERKQVERAARRANATKAAAPTAALLIAAVLIGAPAARAADEVPFAAKLARQRAVSGALTHAWRPGELVRAPVFASCERRLTLVVDAFAPGGLGEFENNDRFRIPDVAVEDLGPWRGRGFDALLEILGPEPDRHGGRANVQTYRAHLRGIAPRAEVANPGRWTTKDLAPRTPVRLSGEVVRITRDELVLQTSFYRYFVSLGQVRPRLDGDLGGLIDAPVVDEPIEPGDVISIYAQVTDAHALVVYPGRPAWLISPSEARRARDAEERRITGELLNTLDTFARQQDWPLARVAFGELQRRRLTPREAARLDEAHARLPGFARPVRVDPTARTTIALVNHTFDIEVDEMTAGELTAFADRWARRRVRARSANAEFRHDEALIYAALLKVGVPADDVADVARRAIRDRVRWLDLRARTGVGPDASVARAVAIIEDSLAVLAQTPNVVNLRFVVVTALELARRAEHDPLLGRRLVPALALTLGRLIESLPAADARDSREELRRRAVTVRRLARRFLDAPAGALFTSAAIALENR